jgi:hypothetical protein
MKLRVSVLPLEAKKNQKEEKQWRRVSASSSRIDAAGKSSIPANSVRLGGHGELWKHGDMT